MKLVNFPLVKNLGPFLLSGFYLERLQTTCFTATPTGRAESILSSLNWTEISQRSWRAKLKFLPCWKMVVPNKAQSPLPRSVHACPQLLLAGWDILELETTKEKGRGPYVGFLTRPEWTKESKRCCNIKKKKKKINDLSTLAASHTLTRKMFIKKNIY